MLSLLPSLHQCSVWRVFNANQSYMERREVRSLGIELGPLALKAAHNQLCHPCSYKTRLSRAFETIVRSDAAVFAGYGSHGPFQTDRTLKNNVLFVLQLKFKRIKELLLSNNFDNCSEISAGLYQPEWMDKLERLTSIFSVGRCEKWLYHFQLELVVVFWYKSPTPKMLYFLFAILSLVNDSVLCSW